MAQRLARGDSARRFEGLPFYLASPARMRAAIEPRGLARAVLSDTTVNALRRKSVDFSAAAPRAVWQRCAPFAALALTGAAVVAFPTAALSALAVALAAPFALVAVLRLLALYSLATSKPKSRRLNRIDDRFLPTYSVLVALYQEAEAAPGLVRALAALDYPRAKLEIVFLVEVDDAMTRQALSREVRLPHMRIVAVPRGLPKTKPRALTYGLQTVSGKLIAVFDAEDVPDRLQLRRAAAAFATSGDELACVQAKLGLYNPHESWFSRQFTIEYAALFEAILPMYERFGVPIPLSGTSNHFRRDLLVEAGGWDPFNLTEDADLGLRFARLGYHVRLIDSTTWEEAPATWRVWIDQRTRWIKGWIQTYLVHMRRPVRLFRDLGARRFLGVQMTYGALVLSALAHPWFYLRRLVLGRMERQLGVAGCVGTFLGRIVFYSRQRVCDRHRAACRRRRAEARRKAHCFSLLASRILAGDFGRRLSRGFRPHAEALLLAQNSTPRRLCNAHRAPFVNRQSRPCRIGSIPCRRGCER